MAIILPMVLLLCVGCLDAGRAIAVYVALSNAARVGCDWAATHRVTDRTRADWQAAIRDDVEAELLPVQGFDADRLSVSATDIAAEGTVRVQVTATYVLEPLLEWPGLPQEFVLERTVVARQFR